MYHSPHGYYHEEYEDLRMMALCMDLSYDESSHIGPHMDPYMDPRTIETRGGGGTPPFLLQIRRAPGSIKSRNQERQVINRELDPPWFTTEARISQARAQPSCREDVWSCRLTPFSGSDCGSRPSAANAQLRHMANCGQAVLEAPCVFAALRAASVYRVVGLLSVQNTHNARQSTGSSAMEEVILTVADLPSGPFRNHDGFHVDPDFAEFEDYVLAHLQVLFNIPLEGKPPATMEQIIVENQHWLNNVEGKATHYPEQWNQFFRRHRHHGETRLDNWVRSFGGRLELPMGRPIMWRGPWFDEWGRPQGRAEFGPRSRRDATGGVMGFPRVASMGNGGRRGFNGGANRSGGGNSGRQRQQANQRPPNVYGPGEDPLPPLDKAVSIPLTIVDAEDMPIHVFYLTDSNPDPGTSNRLQAALSTANTRRKQKGGEAPAVARAALTSNNPKVTKIMDTKRGELFVTETGREDLVVVLKDISDMNSTGEDEGKWRLCGVGTSISEGRMYLLRVTGSKK